ncbi:hypothetical protein A9R00_10025, partial [Oleispira antarctica]
CKLNSENFVCHQQVDGVLSRLKSTIELLFLNPSEEGLTQARRAFYRVTVGGQPLFESLFKRIL